VAFSSKVSDIHKLKIYAKKGKIEVFSDCVVQYFEKTEQKFAIMREPCRPPLDLCYKPKKDYYFGQSITKKPSFQTKFFISRY
jgi:hypothetical protein